MRLIGLCGILGASSLLALAADLISLLTLPFFACYVTATLVYRWSLSTLSALFNVFRGEYYAALLALKSLADGDGAQVASITRFEAEWSLRHTTWTLYF